MARRKIGRPRKRRVAKRLVIGRKGKRGKKAARALVI